MNAIKTIETKFEEIFVKNAPELPLNIKQFIVRYLPWVNLILGVLALWVAYSLWFWAHNVDRFAQYTNGLNASYGGATIDLDRMSFGLWLAVAVLLVEAVIYIAAFPATRKREKKGWDLMFYAALINVAYAFVVVFTSYGSFGGLIMSLVGSAIGFYLLFQIRSHYLKQVHARKLSKKD